MMGPTSLGPSDGNVHVQMLLQVEVLLNTKSNSNPNNVESYISFIIGIMCDSHINYTIFFIILLHAFHTINQTVEPTPIGVKCGSMVKQGKDLS